MSLASVIASSSLSKGVTWQQGPKISSWTMGERPAEAGPDRWARTQAPPARSPGMVGHTAAGDHGGAFARAPLVIAEHFLAMLRRDQRANVVVGVLGAAAI